MSPSSDRPAQQTSPDAPTVRARRPNPEPMHETMSMLDFVADSSEVGPDAPTVRTRPPKPMRETLPMLDPVGNDAVGPDAPTVRARRLRTSEPPACPSALDDFPFKDVHLSPSIVPVRDLFSPAGPDRLPTHGPLQALGLMDRVRVSDPLRAVLFITVVLVLYGSTLILSRWPSPW